MVTNKSVIFSQARTRPDTPHIGAHRSGLLLVDTTYIGVNPERSYLVVAQRLVGSVSSNVVYIAWGPNLGTHLCW